MMRLKDIFVAIGFSLLSGCSAPSDGNASATSPAAEAGQSMDGESMVPTPTPAEMPLFPETLLSEFLQWNGVLPGEGSFPSDGHSGQRVRVFFNEIARPTFMGGTKNIFAPGTLVAKAVVASPQTPTTRATRVYFMRKMPGGYDTPNGDWAYAFANESNGRYVFSPSQGKVGACIRCHSGEAKWDYVRTQQYYRLGRVP